MIMPNCNVDHVKKWTWMWIKKKEGFNSNYKIWNFLARLIHIFHNYKWLIQQLGLTCSSLSILTNTNYFMSSSKWLWSLGTKVYFYNCYNTIQFISNFNWYRGK
jgi:hypothetical protein